MNQNQIIEWLKTSILGIIILGALGSILALILLRFGRWLFRKTIDSAYSRFFFPWFRKPYILHQSLTNRLMEYEDKTKLLIYANWKLGNISITTALFFVMISVNILYFTISGIRLSTSSFILITLTFLVFRMWVDDVIGGLAVYDILLRSDRKSTENDLDKLKQAG